ncbi:MAG: apolipoprotein N-acyltransferase, partial [Thermodesulfobacteriota bacterium]
NAALFFVIQSLRTEAKLPKVEIAIALALLTSTVAYGFIKESSVLKELPAWERKSVAIAQGNVDQAVKWDSAALLGTIDKYRELTLAAAAEGASIVVWPETAMPFFLARSRLGPTVRFIASEADVSILAGSPHFEGVMTDDPSSSEMDLYNSAFVISKNAQLTGRYDKVHLVPFGEYVPLKRLLFFVGKLTEGVGDFSSGSGMEPLSIDGVKVGVLICFESIFPELTRAAIKNNAGLLVNITNDAWFGKTSAPYQHFDMSVMRAVESRTYLVRSANTGISGFIDPTGRVIKKSALFTEEILVSEVGIRRGAPTFFVSVGWLFPIAAIVFSIIMILRCLTKRRAE